MVIKGGSHYSVMPGACTDILTMNELLVFLIPLVDSGTLQNGAHQNRAGDKKYHWGKASAMPPLGSR